MSLEYFIVNVTKLIVVKPKNLNGFKLGDWQYDGDYFNWFLQKLKEEWWGDEIKLTADVIYDDWWWYESNGYIIIEPEIDRS